MVNYSTVKFDPDELVKYSSYALFYSMNKYYLAEKKYKYVCDGARSISHETSIQEHLVRKHGFRYAYCKLHVVYHPVTYFIVRLLFPFISFFERAQESVLIKKVYAVLKQEEIRRTF